MMEYIKPDVQITAFFATERLANQVKNLEDSFQLPSGAEDMSFGEGVEEWGD